MLDLPIAYRPDRAMPPGRLLKEELQAREMSQKDLAQRMGRPVQVISQIVQGKKTVTPQTAQELERVLGTDAQVWLNLQQIHDVVEARQREDERLEQDHEQWRGRLPYRQMVELGWLENEDRPAARLRELMRFFAVGSLDALEPTAQAMGLRISDKAKVDEWALYAWLRQGERVAEAVETAPFDADVLADAVSHIRRLTVVEDFWSTMQVWCAEAGVALVAVPHLPKSGANGVARWLSPQKAMIQLSVRYSWADTFWFTFFHEAAHLLFHDRTKTYVDLSGDTRRDASELEANQFAKETLIPGDAWGEFLSSARFSRASICKLAERVDCHPGIVVGRLQHEQLIWHSQHNDLRQQLRLDEDTS